LADLVARTKGVDELTFRSLAKAYRQQALTKERSLRTRKAIKATRFQSRLIEARILNTHKLASLSRGVSAGLAAPSHGAVRMALHPQSMDFGSIAAAPDKQTAHK